MRALALYWLLLVPTLARAEDSFGSVQRAAIGWVTAEHATITPSALRLEQTSSARSARLPLEPLHLYQLNATLRRGPGTQVGFALVYLDASGQTQRWQPVWQTPGATRANWIPLAPGAQPYVQGVVLPSGAHDAHLELSTAPAPDAVLAPHALFEVTQLSFVEQRSITCCRELGPSKLIGGTLETPLQHDLPIGWTVTAPEAMSRIRVRVDPSERGHVLRVAAHSSVILIATHVPVVPGRAYRLSALIRGQGRVQLSAQALDDTEPMPYRVGSAQPSQRDVNARSWQRLETPWFAEAPGVRAAEVTVAIDTGDAELELDDVELRLYLR